MEGILEVLREEKRLRHSGGLYHALQVGMTYNSNHIEGSRLTQDQTRYIFETNTIGLDKDTSVNVDDIIETVNHFRCIDYVIDVACEPLDEAIILKLHSILKSGTSESQRDWFNVGGYKLKPNTVGGKETTHPLEVENKMRRLIEEYNKIQAVTFEDIVSFHHDFEAIHPFQDGNGRIGRLIAFKECLRFDLTPFIIDEELKFFYYRGLSEWTSERGYLLETCKAGQDKFKLIAKYFFS